MATTRAWAATRKGLFELQRTGAATWRIAKVSFLGEPVSMLLPPRADDPRMLAALNLGHFGVKLHASEDAGTTWQEVPCPTYPEQPADAKGAAWKLVQIWSLEAAHGTVWCGTLPGGLFRSGDFGRGWQLVRSLWDEPGRLEWFGGGYDVPGIHSICPHPTDANELLVGISCGGAWLTTDGGARWQTRTKGMRATFMPPEQAENPNTQDPHLIARCRAAPEVFWCQHHCGIWRSADNAQTWQEITAVEPSTFGFAVAAHPGDPDTAWFAPGVADQQRVPVGAALVVTRTRDGGQSFEALRQGLPQQHCYDLVYRHGLMVAERWPDTLDGHDHGQPVGQRRRGRAVAGGEHQPAADRGCSLWLKSWAVRVGSQRPAVGHKPVARARRPAPLTPSFKAFPPFGGMHCVDRRRRIPH